MKLGRFGSSIVGDNIDCFTLVATFDQAQVCCKVLGGKVFIESINLLKRPGSAQDVMPPAKHGIALVKDPHVQTGLQGVHGVQQTGESPADIPCPRQTLENRNLSVVWVFGML